MSIAEIAAHSRHSSARALRADLAVDLDRVFTRVAPSMRADPQAADRTLATLKRARLAHSASPPTTPSAG
jgi:hypothetical protein